MFCTFSQAKDVLMKNILSAERKKEKSQGDFSVIKNARKKK